MSDIQSIDIECKSIINWLLQRKKLPNEYGQKLRAIKLKLKDVIEDSDFSNYPKISKYIKENSDKMNYFFLHEICEMILQTPEAEKKNLLGGYSSKLVKNWLGVRQLYRKNNLHIADIAKEIDKNLTFEIQGIKKELSLFENQIKNKVDQIQMANSSIKHTESEIKAYTLKNEIQLEDVETSLKSSILKLPEILQSIVTSLQTKKVKDSIQFYKRFVNYINGDTELLDLKVLCYIVNNDNNLVEDFLSGSVSNLSKKRYDILTSHIEKVFSDQSSSKENDMVWEIKLEESSGKVEGKTDIQNEEEFEIIGQSDADEEIEYKETILMSKIYREKLICELEEILQFFTQRISESQNHSIQSIFQTYQSSEHEGIFDFTVDNLVAFKKNLENIIAQLNCYKFRNFISLLDHPKTIIDNIQVMKEKISKKEREIKSLNERISELEDKKAESSQDLTTLSHETANYRPFVEKELSSLMGVEIKIVGAITKLVK